MKAQELAEQLIGTSGVLCVDPAEQLDEGETEEFDRLAFSCDGCGWWCSTEELNNDTDDQLCDDCVPGDEDG